MAKSCENNPLKLKEIILNARQPTILRKFRPEWMCCNQTLEQWCMQFDESMDGADVEFEQMPVKSCTSHPQWERERTPIKMAMKEFLKRKDSKEYWLALNYKTPDEIPLKCQEGVDFNCFGFSDVTKNFARFWLSTSNANTPCHRDTYGCNIVVQAFGSKQWLLFPPHASLTATRLPYEESSIYCKENFYAPDVEQVNDLKRLESDAYVCTLEAGDVLIVPRCWWHFVETKTAALSINAWIPLDVDKPAQLEECIVKFIIEAIVRKETTEVVDHMLNPNQKDILPEMDTLSILAFLASTTNTAEDEDNEVQRYPYQYLDESQFERLLGEIPNAALVQKCSSGEYKALIIENSKRYLQNSAQTTPSPINHIKEALINSICAENVLTEIVKEFTKRLDF